MVGRFVLGQILYIEKVGELGEKYSEQGLCQEERGVIMTVRLEME